nr:unnamed protein product [Spirometra erinaceieuropaei]
MIRDLVYLTEDFSVRCCYVVIVLNYWKPFQLQARNLSKRRLYIHLYGLDLHVFNRTSVYDNLRKLFEIKPQTDGSDTSKDDHQHHPSLVIIHPDAPYPVSTDRDPIHPETEPASENSMGWIWTRCELLFPVVKFNLEMSKVTFGNHLMPRTLVLTCHKANGVYSTEPTSYSFGKYLHVMKLDFSNFMGSLAAVSKYSGHYAIEDPPKGADIFHVFNFGKGKITYEQDEPDWDLIRSAGSIGFDEGCQNTQDSPKWDMSINVSRDFLLAYGPWADRQREIIWKFFFPASYRPLEVPKPDERNPHQANERFLLKLISQTDVRLDLWFSTNRIPKTFSVYGKSNSVFELNLPWTSGADGFTSRMHLRLSEGRLVTDCLWQDLLLTSEFRMDLSIHYPLEWNALQTWDFDIDGKEAKCCFLYTQKDYFKGRLVTDCLWQDLLLTSEFRMDLSIHYPLEWNALQTWDFDIDGKEAKCCFLYTQKDYFKEFFEDWSSGSRPDILSFVPYIYTFRINARPLELRLLANDFNWVAPTPENAFIAFCLKKFTFTFNLPFSEFLPTTVPVEFGIKGSTASCCLSLPETSTMLYVIKELHNNLKLVDCKCRPQQQNPFRIIEEVLEAEKGGQTGNSIGDPAVHTSRSLGVRFGESLLFPDRLIFQLHDQSICAEYSNGYALMRTEVVRADEAAKFELMPEATDSDLVCTCCHLDDSDSECSSPEEKAFEDSARSSAKTQASSSSNTSDGEGSKPPSRSGDHELSTDPFSNDPLVIQLSNDTDSLHIDSRGRSQNHRRRDRRHETTGLLASLSLTSLISSVVRPSSSSDESDNPNSSSSSSSRSTCQPPARPQPATPVDSVNPIRLPPTPPPRQHGVATSGLPVEPSSLLPSVHSAATVQPLRSDISGPPTVQKQLSEESTLSDDGNTNFVDLQSQLNRPITESTLLRTAYSRHLNCYITPVGSICPELRLRRRWRLCRRFLQGSNDEGDLNSLVGPSAATSSSARAGEEDVAHEKRVGRCRCRIGIARAPEFFCSAAGFSFRSMVDKKAPLPSQTLNSSFCIADLRPLLYPCMLSGTSSSILVSRSSTTVSVLGPVDIFLTPLFVECMDRYISVMVPVMANLPPATVIDELHFKCVRSASQRGKVLYGEGEQSSSQAPPSPSPTSQPSNQPRLSFAPPTVLEARQHQQPQSTRRGLLGTRASISTSLEPEVAFRPAFVGPSLASAVKNEPTNTIPSASGIKLRSAPADEKDEQDAQEPATRANQFLSLGASRSCSRGHLVEENNLVGLLTLGRINVGFMQIYAIEDVVTVDSMTTGLHDLTCVSLLTLAVDSVKILHNARTTHYGTFVDSTFRGPASLIAPVVAAQAPESALETADQNSSTAQARCAEAGSAPTVVSDDATPEFTAASPLLNHELPEPTPGSPHAVAFEERTSIPSATSAQAQAANQRVEEPMLRRLPVVREVRQTARLVCNFSISRIHSQLRRLTRDSNFNPDVLLTAIPFQSSRVFFAFDSDAAAIAARSPLRRGDHPSPLGPPKPLPPPRTAPLPQPAQSFLHGHSAGWIMVECGMEQLSLLFVQRKGFGDSVEEYRPGGGGRNDSNEETMRKTATSASPTDPAESPEQHRQDADAGAASKKPTTEHVGAHQLDEFSRMEEGLGAETSNAVGDQTNQSDSHTRSTVVNPLSDGGEVESRMKNALLMHLHVQTVWLNFPAPKHLPNKRRVEIVRSDWNFLSTVTPTVNAWIGPFNRLVANSKHLHAVSERRHLSVLACLMMESVSGGDGSDVVAPSGNMQPSPQPQVQLRFSSLEDADFSAYATWRTSASQLLRYDPSCQIFTVLRRYLQSLRAQRGSQFTDTALAEWLREPAVPENILLFRGLLLMLRQCSYCVDIFQPVRLPSVKKGLLNARRSIFRHLRDSTLGKTVEGDATAAAAATASTTTGTAVGGGSSVAVERSVATTTARGPRERWWGQESARMHRPSFAKGLAATARVPSVCGPLASASTDDRTGRTGGVLPRRPSATVLTMFDLMTSENGHWEDKRIVGAPAAREQHQLGVKGDTSSLAGVSDVASDLDDTLDDTTTSEAKGRCESSILSRFLLDTQAGLA